MNTAKIASIAAAGATASLSLPVWSQGGVAKTGGRSLLLVPANGTVIIMR